MIINTGQRTDIPAFYSEWFINRIKEGFVYVRNPYYPAQINKYLLNPEVVDVLSFCTKNPEPMLKYLPVLKPFRQFWFVSITPYGKEIEPNVPEKSEVISSFKKLSRAVGKNAVGWRYDPIFISKKYSVEYHIRAFEKMAKELAPYTGQAVISFIDLYKKTRKNFPLAREVSIPERLIIGEKFSEIARQYGITLRTCCEGKTLAKFGIDTGGCITKAVMEKAIGEKLAVPKRKSTRSGCTCLIGNDIGAYNTCMHFCKYCYANYDKAVVLKNAKKHNPKSPLLVGDLEKGDVIKLSSQTSFITNQITLEI